MIFPGLFKPLPLEFPPAEIVETEGVMLLKFNGLSREVGPRFQLSQLSNLLDNAPSVTWTHGGAIRWRQCLIGREFTTGGYILASWDFSKFDLIPFRLVGESVCYDWPNFKGDADSFLYSLLGTSSKARKTIKGIEFIAGNNELENLYLAFCKWCTLYRGHSEETRFESLFFGQSRKDLQRAFNLANRRIQ